MVQSREEKLRKVREANRRRMADPAYREKVNEQRRRKRAEDPEWRAKTNEWKRKYRATPEAKERQRQSRRRSAVRNRALVDEFKGKCAICGRADPRCLVVHHSGPKNFDIGLGVRVGFSVERMRAELANCQCLCASCHMIEHARLEARAARME